jgi:hypothetical protein
LPATGILSLNHSDAPIAFGEALIAGTRLIIFSNDKPDRFFTVIKFWMDETSGIALAFKSGVLAINSRMACHAVGSASAGPTA